MELQQTKLALADDMQIRGIFEEVGVIIQKKEDCENQELLFRNKEEYEGKEVAKCEGCGAVMTMANFGHLAKGSNLFYCKNPLCFSHYIANKKLR